MSGEEIAAAAQLACLLEVSAPKPGNVSPARHFHDTRYEDFLASAVAQQIVEIERGRREPQVRVGNLSAQRDFTDVRDVVAAYRALAAVGQSGQVYNVCPGRAIPSTASSPTATRWPASR